MRLKPFGLALVACSLSQAQQIQARINTSTVSSALYPEKALQLAAAMQMSLSEKWSAELEYSQVRSPGSGFSVHRDRTLWLNFVHDYRTANKRVVPFSYLSIGARDHLTRSIGYRSADIGLDLGVGAGVRLFLHERVFLAPRLRLVGSNLSAEKGVSLGLVLRR